MIECCNHALAQQVSMRNLAKRNCKLFGPGYTRVVCYSSDGEHEYVVV